MLQSGDPGDLTLSADGSTLVFSQGQFGLTTAYAWDASAGTRALSQEPFRPVACSADGTVVIGNASQPFFEDTPLLWTEAGGIELLPHLNGSRSTVRCMSDDGTVLGGTSARDSVNRAASWRITVGLGTTVCTPTVPNSVGAFSSMAIQGNNLLEFQPMRLQASDLPVSSFGYFLVSNQQGSSMPPGSLGTLCLAGEVGRYSRPGEVLMANAQGGVELTIDPAALPGPTGTRIPTFGEPWTFQFWYRDSINGAPTSHLTSAVEIRFY